jgi:predicted GNAT family N-acyltransferase
VSSRLLIITDYQSHETDIRTIRDQVFLIEQQVPPHEELDDRDAVCLHVVVYESDVPVGTGRLDVEKGGKIGRIAVLSEHRCRGIGRQIMQALVDAATERQLDRIWFHAQLSAVPFYERLGYQPCGEEFVEAGIPHILMQRQLA